MVYCSILDILPTEIWSHLLNQADLATLTMAFAASRDLRRICAQIGQNRLHILRGDTMILLHELIGPKWQYVISYIWNKYRWNVIDINDDNCSGLTRGLDNEVKIYCFCPEPINIIQGKNTRPKRPEPTEIYLSMSLYRDYIDHIMAYILKYDDNTIWRSRRINITSAWQSDEIYKTLIRQNCRAVLAYEIYRGHIKITDTIFLRHATKSIIKHVYSLRPFSVFGHKKNMIYCAKNDIFSPFSYFNNLSLANLYNLVNAHTDIGFIKYIIHKRLYNNDIEALVKKTMGYKLTVLEYVTDYHGFVLSNATMRDYFLALITSSMRQEIKSYMDQSGNGAPRNSSTSLMANWLDYLCLRGLYKPNEHLARFGPLILAWRVKNGQLMPKHARQIRQDIDSLIRQDMSAKVRQGRDSGGLNEVDGYIWICANYLDWDHVHIRHLMVMGADYNILQYMEMKRNDIIANYGNIVHLIKSMMINWTHDNVMYDIIKGVANYDKEFFKLGYQEVALWEHRLRMYHYKYAVAILRRMNKYGIKLYYAANCQGYMPQFVDNVIGAIYRDYKPKNPVPAERRLAQKLRNMLRPIHY